MSDQGSHPLVFPVLVIMVCAIMTTMLAFTSDWNNRGNNDEQNMVKIECFLHRDNADVHKLCVDHGYDR